MPREMKKTRKTRRKPKGSTRPRRAPPVFWASGIRFECQGTGRCCMSRGAYGFVYLTLADRRRLARHFDMPTRAFTLAHCANTDGHFHLKQPDRDCLFLDGKRCLVYEARPLQCRTWPFWPDNMKAKTWNKDVAAFCPGIGKGRLFSGEEIGRLLARQRRIPFFNP
jgi:uncharacterized protein